MPAVRCNPFRSCQCFQYLIRAIGNGNDPAGFGFENKGPSRIVFGRIRLLRISACRFNIRTAFHSRMSFFFCRRILLAAAQQRQQEQQEEKQYEKTFFIRKITYIKSMHRQTPWLRYIFANVCCIAHSSSALPLRPCQRVKQPPPQTER